LTLGRIRRISKLITNPEAQMGTDAEMAAERGLRRRLRAALAGIRLPKGDTGPVYFVVERAAPYKIWTEGGRFFRTQERADEASARAGDRYVARGPFMALDADLPSPEIIEITIKYRAQPGGAEQSFRVPEAPEVDAIFLSRAAYENFALPYYCQMFEAADVLATEEGTVKQVEGTQLYAIVHKWWCK
jgi:hypothetical protein